jgi:putative oxidoreductase
MESFLGSYGSQAYALMRIVFGLLFLSHGAQKVFGMFGGINGAAVPLSSLFGVAGVIELVLGALIALGLLGGYAAFVASGEMAVAYFTAHFPHGFWPLENKGEEAVLYCFAFLYLATQGSGIWSVDGAGHGKAAGRRRLAYR